MRLIYTENVIKAYVCLCVYVVHNIHKTLSKVVLVAFRILNILFTIPRHLRVCVLVCVWLAEATVSFMVLVPQFIQRTRHQSSWNLGTVIYTPNNSRVSKRHAGKDLRGNLPHLETSLSEPLQWHPRSTFCSVEQQTSVPISHNQTFSVKSYILVTIVDY